MVKSRKNSYRKIKKKSNRKLLKSKRKLIKSNRKLIKNKKGGALNGLVYAGPNNVDANNVEANNVEANNLEAKNCWEKAAKKGSNGAFYNLAVLYANGWGVSKDSKKAIRYYKKNIKKKNDYYDMSLLAIARHYFEGLGTNKNIKKGTNLYEQAAKIGNLRAMFELAHMFDEYNSFERYNMVKKNNDLAIKYYIQLAKNNYIFGHYAAMQILREEIKKYRNVKKNIKKFNLVIRLLKKYKDNIQKIDEEFESKCAKMNFTREQIIKQRKNYNDLRDKSLVYIDEIKEISLKENE